MAEYKGLTHTIVEMIARNKIQAVPRNKDTPRTKVPEVGRPDDDRFGEVPTRQQEIQKKIIDEQDVQTAETQKAVAPTKARKPKKLEIEDIGKQPPTKVEINPELDNTPNVFASTEVKGNLVTEETMEKVHAALKNSGFAHKDGKWHFPGIMTQKHADKLHDEMTKAGMERSPGAGTHSWFHRRNRILVRVGGKTGEHYHANVQTWNEETIKEDDKPDAKSKREAEDIAKLVSGIKSFGGFKVTGSLTPEDIKKGAEIRARLNKLKESRDEYNNVSIQYQTRGGNWITARKTSNQPSDIMLAMRTVQKAYSSNRVRAIGAKGFVLDFQPIDPSSIATEETSEKDLQKAKGRTIEAWWDNKPKALKNFKQVSKALKKKDLDEGGSGVGAAAAKALISGVAVQAALGAVKRNFPTAYGIADTLQKGYGNLPPTPGYSAFAKAGEGDKLSASATVGKYNPDLYQKWKLTQDNTVAKNKIKETVDSIVSEILTYKNSASLRARDAVAQRDAAIAQAQQAQAQQQQQPPQQKKKQQPVQEAKDTRHTGIEVEEPKFNQSIQRVAAHTKWNAGAVHTYRHADGSKTRVDQELGTKIHHAIHSAPTRHRADIVQKIHGSKEGLEHILKHGWHGKSK